MSKKIALVMALSLIISALAIGGYRFLSPMAKEPIKIPVPADSSRTDLFASQELIAVLKPFQEARSIDASFTTMLLGSDGKTDMGSFEGRYIRDSIHLYIKSIESENILNRDFFIAVDHGEKMIFVEKPEFSSTGPNSFLQSGFLSDIDSLVKLPDSLVFYERIDAQTAKLRLEWSSGHYYRTELIYDIETKMLKRIHLYPYQNIFLEPEEGEISETMIPGERSTAEEIPEYVAIIYHFIRLNEEVSQKWFSASKFFSVQNNQLIATKSYKDYEIDFE